MAIAKEHLPFFAVFAALAIIFGGSKPPSPPVVVEKGIKVTSFNSAAQGAVIGWEVLDESIIVGEDIFIVQYRERQIPRKGGYSDWKTLGSTKETSFSSKEFLRNRDIIVRIAVDKGAVADEE
jgi:hypothetical protein